MKDITKTISIILFAITSKGRLSHLPSVSVHCAWRSVLQQSAMRHSVPTSTQQPWTFTHRVHSDLQTSHLCFVLEHQDNHHLKIHLLLFHHISVFCPSIVQCSNIKLVLNVWECSWKRAQWNLCLDIDSVSSPHSLHYPANAGAVFPW